VLNRVIGRRKRRLMPGWAKTARLTELQRQSGIFAE
jgi:hypothetical protein